jgi:DNA-binding XRE family transcriptional regulator
MTPAELIQWRTSIALSKREAAEALGLARNTFRAYESGKQPIPRYIELAVKAVSSSAISFPNVELNNGEQKPIA